MIEISRRFFVDDFTVLPYTAIKHIFSTANAQTETSGQSTIHLITIYI